ISLKCVSLPIEVQNLHDNMHISMLIPPFKGEPGQDVIDNYLRLLVEIFIRGWERGIRLSRTAHYPDGRNVVFALIYAVADLKARVKVAGVQDHAAHRCGGICDCVGSDTHRRFDYSSWRPLTVDEMKDRAARWRTESTASGRQKAFRTNGARDSIMYRLPYWNPVRQVVIDPMH
ncbi:hypothetical protein PUNSTDRAFT_38379, partial [Punctularia strigosozonata HHB-11173 SS5]|uniref:uncharacterized protein n=1 Tax=Punctularia strigosozonata (strain HHB-11173) TaxID=741275 RepID=UPI000441871E